MKKVVAMVLLVAVAGLAGCGPSAEEIGKEVAKQQELQRIENERERIKEEGERRIRESELRHQRDIDEIRGSRDRRQGR